MRAKGVADFIVVVPQFMPVIHPHIAEDAVQQNAVVPFAQNEHIAVWFFRVFRVKPHKFVIQRYGDIGSRHWAADVYVTCITSGAGDTFADFAGFFD